MKICQCCRNVSDGVTCPHCGEASWDETPAAKGGLAEEETRAVAAKKRAEDEAAKQAEQDAKRVAETAALAASKAEAAAQLAHAPAEPPAQAITLRVTAGAPESPMAREPEQRRARNK